jgi:hypothetical protein
MLRTGSVVLVSAALAALAFEGGRGTAGARQDDGYREVAGAHYARVEK